MSRFVLPGLTGLALVLGSLCANAGDLKDAAARQAAAKEKLQGDVRAAIERSKKATDSSEARNTIEFMLRDVRDSRILLETERASLVQSLQAQLVRINNAATAKKANDSYRPPSQPPITKAADYPVPGGKVADVAREWMKQPRNAAELHNQLIRDREKANLNIMLGVEKTSPLPDYDTGIAFPKYWAQLKKEREKLVSQQLTDREKKLLKTLNSTLSVNYRDVRFKAVLEDLQDKTGLALIVDPNSERDLNLDYDDLINLKTEKATVRTILKAILGQEKLTYIIKEANIQIMTPERAKNETVVRAYDISDMVAPNPQMMMMYGPMFGPQMQQMQAAQNANQLIQIIMMTTDPGYWQPNGPGSIVYYAPTRSLLVRASAEMHFQMASPGMFGR